MSLVSCDDCSCFIDSDEDGDCFLEVGNQRSQTEDIVLCCSCRENRIEELNQLEKEPRNATNA